MFNLIEWYRRRVAIKKYLKLLGPSLKAKYGEKRSYEASEVVGTVRELKISEKYMLFAIALYCTREQYEKIMDSPQPMAMDYAAARSIGFNIALSKFTFSKGEAGSSSESGGDSGSEI